MLRLGLELGRSHGGGKQLETDLDLAGGQAKRRAEPDGARAAGQQEQSAVKGQVDNPVAQQGGRIARPVLHLQPHHQPLSPDLANARKAMSQGVQPGAKLGPADRGIDAVSLLDQPQGRQCRCARNGVTAECRSMAAAGPVHHRGPRHDRPQGQTVGNPLGQAHDIALDPPVLARKVPAGPAKSALHLVEHQQHPVLVANLAQTGQEIVRGYDVAALTLDRLDEDRRQLIGRTDRPQQGVHAVEIAIARVVDFWNQGAKPRRCIGLEPESDIAPYVRP